MNRRKNVNSELRLIGILSEKTGEILDDITGCYLHSLDTINAVLAKLYLSIWMGVYEKNNIAN